MNTNIRYGTYYLSMIQSQLSGNAVLATAGYNAGPNRAKTLAARFSAMAADSTQKPFHCWKHVITSNMS